MPFHKFFFKVLFPFVWGKKTFETASLKQPIWILWDDFGVSVLAWMTVFRDVCAGSTIIWFGFWWISLLLVTNFTGVVPACLENFSKCASVKTFPWCVWNLAQCVCATFDAFWAKWNENWLAALHQVFEISADVHSRSTRESTFKMQTIASCTWLLLTSVWHEWKLSCWKNWNALLPDNCSMPPHELFQCMLAGVKRAWAVWQLWQTLKLWANFKHHKVTFKNVYQQERVNTTPQNMPCNCCNSMLSWIKMIHPWKQNTHVTKLLLHSFFHFFLLHHENANNKQGENCTQIGLLTLVNQLLRSWCHSWTGQFILSTLSAIPQRRAEPRIAQGCKWKLLRLEETAILVNHVHNRARQVELQTNNSKNCECVTTTLAHVAAQPTPGHSVACIHLFFAVRIEKRNSFREAE